MWERRDTTERLEGRGPYLGRRCTNKPRQEAYIRKRKSKAEGEVTALEL